MNRLFQVVPICPLRCCFSRPAYYCWAVWWRGQWCRISKSVFTSAAQSQHRGNVCWGEQLCAYSLRSGFWHSLWMTVWYTALVVAGSTVLGLAVAMFFNREFRLRKTARFVGDPLLRNAIHFAGVRTEIHVQQRLRHCELPRRRSSASL